MNAVILTPVLYRLIIFFGVSDICGAKPSEQKTSTKPYNTPITYNNDVTVFSATNMQQGDAEENPNEKHNRKNSLSGYNRSLLLALLAAWGSLAASLFLFMICFIIFYENPEGLNYSLDDINNIEIYWFDTMASAIAKFDNLQDQYRNIYPSRLYDYESTTIVWNSFTDEVDEIWSRTFYPGFHIPLVNRLLNIYLEHILPIILLLSNI